MMNSYKKKYNGFLLVRCGLLKYSVFLCYKNGSTEAVLTDQNNTTFKYSEYCFLAIPA